LRCSRIAASAIIRSIALASFVHGQIGFQRLHAFATQGSSIAHAEFELSNLQAVVAELNKRFDLSLSASEGLYPKILWGLRRAAGRFLHERYTVERPAVARRLKKLKASAYQATIALSALDEGIRDDHDVAAIRLLRDALHEGEPALSPEELDGRFQLIRYGVDQLYHATKDDA
jgi:hypothetical protein